MFIFCVDISSSKARKSGTSVSKEALLLIFFFVFLHIRKIGFLCGSSYYSLRIDWHDRGWVILGLISLIRQQTRSNSAEIHEIKLSEVGSESASQACARFPADDTCILKLALTLYITTVTITVVGIGQESKSTQESTLQYDLRKSFWFKVWCMRVIQTHYRYLHSIMLMGLKA